MSTSRQPVGRDSEANAPVPWRRNLACIWVAQVLSLMGFGFGMSFAAYYIQSLGVTDPRAVKLWTGAYLAAGPLTFAVMSPVWGALGDRFGRRLMMLRANFAAAVIISLMGWVTSIHQLIGLRLLQGVFTGTISAAVALVAVATPEKRFGLALGFLQTGTVVGWMSGSALGGFLADRFGYARTVRLGGGLLLAAGLVVLLLVREDFVPPSRTPGERRSWLPSPSALAGAWPILGLFLFVGLSTRFDSVVLPLLVQELNGGLDGAATLMGKLAAVCSLSMGASALLCGYLVDRVRPALIAACAALAAGILVASQFFVYTIVWLGVVRMLLAVCMGGLEPAFQVWLARATPSERRGQIVGFSVSAKNVGWIVASMSSAFIATQFGLRPVFVVAGSLLVCLVVLIGCVCCTVKA